MTKTDKQLQLLHDLLCMAHAIRNGRKKPLYPEELARVCDRARTALVDAWVPTATSIAAREEFAGYQGDGTG
jgi:hypothetical protein